MNEGLLSFFDRIKLMDVEGFLFLIKPKNLSSQDFPGPLVLGLSFLEGVFGLTFEFFLSAVFSLPSPVSLRFLGVRGLIRLSHIF